MRVFSKFPLLFFTLLMVSVASASGYDASKFCSPFEQTISADNETFIKTWGPKFKFMNDGIPELSPKESAWLDDELNSNNAKRHTNARTSKEYALRSLKQWAVSIDVSTNNFFENNTKNWAYIAYLFVDSTSSSYLVDLVNAGVISREIVPCEWQIFGFDANLINEMRMYFAQSILSKNLINSLAK